MTYLIILTFFSSRYLYFYQKETFDSKRLRPSVSNCCLLALRGKSNFTSKTKIRDPDGGFPRDNRQTENFRRTSHRCPPSGSWVYTSNSKTKLPSSDGFPISVGYNVDFESRFKYEQILLGQILTLPPKPTGFLVYIRWISGGYPIGLWARNKGEKYQNQYNSHQIILDQLQKYSPPTISAKL